MVTYNDSKVACSDHKAEVTCSDPKVTLPYTPPLIPICHEKLNVWWLVGGNLI